MTTVRKDTRSNWTADDQVDLVAPKVLKISTHKVSGGMLVTTATVHIRDGGFLSHMMFQDFSQRLMTAQVRCTEKNVTVQHAEAMTKLAEIKEAVTAHYAKELA